MSDEHENLVRVIAEARRLNQRREAMFDTLYPRGVSVRWQASGCVRSGVVIATAFGRRVFVADFITGTAHWAGCTSLIPPGQAASYHDLAAA